MNVLDPLTVTAFDDEPKSITSVLSVKEAAQVCGTTACSDVQRETGWSSFEETSMSVMIINMTGLYATVSACPGL